MVCIFHQLFIDFVQKYSYFYKKKINLNYTVTIQLFNTYGLPENIL